MLDDPKVAKLSDSSYRRFIECLLLAGEADEGGILPPIDDMAWRLRLSNDALEKDLSRLALSGLLHLNEMEQWVVTKFDDRQQAVKGAERVRRFRERERRNEYYNEPVTNPVTKRYTDTDTDIDKDTEPPVAAAGLSHADVFAVYENEMGGLSKIISQKIEYATDEYGATAVIAAIETAVQNNVRKWAYVDGVLRRKRAGGTVRTATKDDETLWQRIMGIAAGGDFKTLEGAEREAARVVGPANLRGFKPERFKTQFLEAYHNAKQLT